MATMRNLGQPAPAPRRNRIGRIVLWLAGIVVAAAVVITGAYYFDVVTESEEFCGLLCHANRPEYAASQVSAHSEVECGVCHIGPGLVPKVTAKIYGVAELYRQLTNTYDRPIELPVERLRPAEDICVQCHWPGKLREDELRVRSVFASDEANTEARTVLAMRVGGGTFEKATEDGAHWHIDSISYAALDAENQDIPWVRVERDGEIVEYLAAGSSATADELAAVAPRSMDCLDCHNRSGHAFLNPERVLDDALAAGIVDRNLPFVKREATRLLTGSYPSQEAGLEAMAGLQEFYRSKYPDVFDGNQLAVEQAVEVLEDIYRSTVFPEMNLTWEAYPDNSAHTSFPGCFRCHDGQHVNAAGEAIPANCTTCHSVPLVVRDDGELDWFSTLSLIARPQAVPESHQQTTFLGSHFASIDDTCSDCHGRTTYGVDDSGFCANSACHGQVWPVTPIDLELVHPVELVDGHATAACSDCHVSQVLPEIENCDGCHAPPGEVHFGSECAKCHTPKGWQESAQSWSSDVPIVPHPAEGLADCLICHGAGQAVASPASHGGIPEVSCLLCHEAAVTAPSPGIPHRIEGVDDCLTCHGLGLPSAFPATHEGIETDLCLVCHAAEPPARVSGIPHPVEGREVCVSCHRAGGLEPPPLDHAERTNESCLLCHSVE